MKTLIFLSAFFFIFFSALSQPIVGFWGVSSVVVGERTMTPVAKWFRYNSDGTFQSGNGWTQNAVGTWTFDTRNSKLSSSNTNGIKDDYGPFLVTPEGSTVVLERQEDGMKVRVTLVKIDAMPAAPADQICGLWKLEKVTGKDGHVKNDFDPGLRQFLHVRPDRRYRLRNPDGTFAHGYWHMDGHKPEFTLINDDRKIDYAAFTVAIEGDNLALSSRAGQDLVFHYTRIFEFPR